MSISIENAEQLKNVKNITNIMNGLIESGVNLDRIKEVLTNLRAEQTRMLDYNTTFQSKRRILTNCFKAYMNENGEYEVKPDVRKNLRKLLKNLQLITYDVSEQCIGRCTAYNLFSKAIIDDIVIVNQKSFSQDKTYVDPFDIETSFVMFHKNEVSTKGTIGTEGDKSHKGDDKKINKLLAKDLMNKYEIDLSVNDFLIFLENVTIADVNDEYLGKAQYPQLFQYKQTIINY